MKKRNKNLGLVGKVLVGAMAISTLFPSFVNAQEKISSKNIKSEEKNLILKKELEIDYKKNISLSESQKLYFSYNLEKTTTKNSTKAVVTHPEWYQYAGIKSISLPYCRPNIQLLLGKDSTDWRGSRDANRDRKIESVDAISIRDGTYVSAKTSDYNLDGTVTNADADGIDSSLVGQKEADWTLMGASQKLEESRKRQNIDTSNHFVDPFYRDCTDYSFSHTISFTGVEDWINSPHYDSEYGENAVENIQYYEAVWQTPMGTWHQGGAIFVGTDSGSLDDQNPLDKPQWYIFDTSRRDEYETIWVQPGDVNMALTTKLRINAYLKYPGEISKDAWGTETMVEFNIVNGNVESVTPHPYLIPFNPASSHEEITLENVPENIIVNYQPDIDLSGYESQMPDTAYAKSNLPTSLEGIVSAIIPLDEEYPEIHYKKQITYKASTGYKDSIIIRDIEVKDISGPDAENIPENRSINYSNDLGLDNYVSLENLVVTDNSGVPTTKEKSTYSTQIMDGTINQVRFTQIDSIKLTDYFGNVSKYGVTQQVDDIESPTYNLENVNVEINEADYTKIEDHIKLINKEDNSGLPIEDIYDSYLLESNDLYDKYKVEMQGKDVAENYGEIKTAYLKINKPTGFGNEPSELENKCNIIPYPNPNPHAIKYSQPDFGQTEIYVTNMAGAIVGKNVYNSQAGENNIEYNFDLAQGIYVVTMESENCKDAEKIIIDGRK